MRVIKPQALGLLTRPFEFRRKFYLGVGVTAFLPMSEQIALLPETAMWAFLSDNLPKGMIMDAAMPKRFGEFLAVGQAYAPGGQPVTSLRVGIQLGARIKTLNVSGDRFWDGREASQPAPFVTMPLDWEHAYGGPKFADNPLGMAADVTGASPEAPVKLPNVLGQPRDGHTRYAAGFSAIDITWPSRAKLCGTHDDVWLKQDFPGLPRDIDMRFFNIAPADQQFADVLNGDETYAFENMHQERKLITGRLPDICARAFATRKGDPAFTEIPLRLTTVWFFPAALRMVLVHHGQMEVSEEDAVDVEHLMIAADPAGAPRPIGALYNVMKQRTERSPKGGAHALNDGLLVLKEWLVPDPVIEDQKKLLGGEGIVLGRMRPRMEREHAKMRAELIEKGLDPDKAMKPLPPEEPPPSLEEMPAMLEKLQQQAKEHEATLQAELAKSEAELAPLLASQGISIEDMRAKRNEKPKGPPSFSAAAMRAELQAAVARFRGIGAEAAELEAQLNDPNTQARWEKAEADLREAYRMIAHHQGRPDPLPAEANEKLRGLVADSAAARQHYNFAGADLRGCDFRNADLSGICLDGATLKGCDFSGASLRNAVLAHADLQECRFDKADLAGANLGRADLRGAALRGAVLTKAVLARADFTGANLAGANLEGADVEGMYVAIARFRQIHGGALRVMKMSLAGWDAAGAQLDKALFLDVNLMNADLSFASLAGASFIGCRIQGGNFTGANLAGAKFVNQCEASAVQFSGANLSGAMLRETDLRGSDFSGANLTDADFSKTDLTQSRLRRICAIRARFTAANLTAADIRFANFMNADLARADLRGANLDNANMYEANLARAKLDRATSSTRMKMIRTRTLPHWEPA